MKKRIILSLICFVLLIVTTAMPISAAKAKDPGISPQWEHTSSIDCSLYFEKTTGYAEGLVQTDFGVSSIKIDVFIYKQIGLKWIYVGERHVSNVNKIVLGISHTFHADIGMKYKADFTFTVTKDGVDEVIQRSVTRAY